MGGWKEKETSKQIEIIEGPRLRPASTQSIIARSKIRQAGKGVICRGVTLVIAVCLGG